MIGFGTYKLKDPDIIKCALDLKYPLLDTGELYKNEHIVADAVRKSKSNANIITKISFDSIRKDKLETSFEKRLEIFNDIPIHAILLHHPYKDCRSSWDRLVSIFQEHDDVSYIGVSNYNATQLKTLEGSDVIPKYNEIEINPFCNNCQETIEYCRENQIDIIAHTPLSRGDKLYDPRISCIAKELKITEAQVLIKWSLQNGYIVIPQANTAERVLENMLSTVIPDFDSDIMTLLDNMNENYALTKIPA